MFLRSSSGWFVGSETFFLNIETEPKYGEEEKIKYPDNHHICFPIKFEMYQYNYVCIDFDSCKNMPVYTV